VVAQDMQHDTELVERGGIVGPQRERLPQAGDGGLVQALLLQRDAQRRMGLRQCRAADQRLPVTGDRFVQALGPLQGIAEVQVRGAQARLQPHGLPAARLGGLPLFQPDQHVAEIAVRGREAGPQSQRAAVAIGSLGELAMRHQDASEIAGDVGVRRQQGHRATQGRQRILVLRHQRDPPGFPRLPVARVLAGELGRQGLHLCQPSGLEVCEEFGQSFSRHQRRPWRRGHV
jgi:hypothetical protein